MLILVKTCQRKLSITGISVARTIRQNPTGPGVHIHGGQIPQLPSRVQKVPCCEDTVGAINVVCQHELHWLPETEGCFCSTNWYIVNRVAHVLPVIQFYFSEKRNDNQEIVCHAG